MNRRIVRVLMVLLVLLCVLPAVVGAAEYKVGDTLWTAGEKPTADTEQYSRWIPVIRPDNVQEYREVANTGTYEYQWIVEEYYGPGEKEGIPTSFAVKNVDPQGDPMVGTEFILFEERGDNLLMIASAITDEEGMAYLKDLCLDDNSDTAVWHLVQTNFPESQMAKTHHPYTGMWDIYVTRDSSGQHTLEMVPSPAAQTMTLGMDDEAETDQQVVDFGEVSGEEPVEENYNEKDKVLTVVNEKIRGRLTIRVEFEDGVVPPGIEIFDVTVVSPDGYKETMTLTRQYPEVTLINAALGNYSFEQTSKMQVDGYNLKTKYMVEPVGEDPVESQVVALTEEKTAATAIVLNCYEEVNIANTIHAKVMDKDGKLLKGAQLQLLDENDEVIRTVSETSGTGTFVFDDLANYAVKGETVKFKIRQSKVPEGYDACEYDFNITVEKNNGKVKVSPVKSEFFLLRLFNSGTDEDAAGETVIEFENKLIPSSLDLKIVNTGEACPVDEIPVTVTGLNDTREVTLSEENGWQVKLEKLPRATYTIKQDVDAEGFHLVEEYDAFGVDVTGNQVALKVKNAELTVKNVFSLKTGKLVVEMGFAEDVIPAALKSIPVKVTGRALYVKRDIDETVNVTAQNGWTAELELPLGTYTVAQDLTQLVAEGYELTPDPAQTKKVTLEEDKPITCAFTNQFTEREEPLPERIVIQMEDGEKKPVAGVRVGLFLTEDGSPHEFGPSDATGQIIIDDLAGKMEMISVRLKDGERLEAALRQTEVPDGYKLSEQEYQVFVEKNGDEIIYGVTDADTSETEILLTFTNDVVASEGPETPNDTLPEKIIVQMQDAEKNPVAGVKIGLFEAGSKYPAKEVGPSDENGQIVVDNLERYVNMVAGMLSEGERQEIILKQTEVPEGYKLSEQEYSIAVEKTDGEIIYGVTGVDTSGTEVLVTFTNDVIASEGPETPGDALPEKIIVQMQDAEKNPVAGVKIGLFEAGGKYPLREVGPSDENGQIVVDNLERYVNMVAGMLSEGERKEIILKQTEVPEGYKLSEQEYSIAVEKTDGEIIYGVTGVDTSGTEVLVTFTNEAVQDDPPATNPTEPEPTEPKPTAPKPSGSTTSDDESKNQIGIRTLDTNGAPLAGAKYGLYYGATAIRSYTDYGTGQINIEDLEMLLGNYIDDPAILYTPLTLRQTQPPLGGKLSSKTYDVYVYIDDEGMKVNVKGSEIDANGVQLVDFVHSVSEETQPTQATAPKSNEEEKEPDVIVIRTVDESGNVLSGAEYCLSTDLHFDEDKDIVYSKADRHEEITIEDLEEHVEAGKKATYYLMQCRQPEGGNLSADRFVVELSRKKGNLEIEVKKDAGILERMQGGGVEESTTGEWIVTFNSSAKTSTIQIGYEEVVDWHNCMEAEDVLQQYKKNEYEFQLNWEFAGEKKDPLILKLSNGESGSFDPIPLGAKYEIVPVQDGCYKLEFTKGELTGVATQANLDLKAKITYNIDKDAPLTIEMLKLDSKTEKPLPGVVYTLKNSEKEEVDVYKTDGSGKLLIDAITEPGEYTLSESEVPEGYHKLKKDIGISVSVAFKESVDGNGDPMILQTLEAVVSHSQVRQKLDGTYRIGTAQSSGSGILPVVLGAGAVVAVGAGAGVAVLHNKKRRGFRR